jgi:hypothetical protein
LRRRIDDLVRSTGDDCYRQRELLPAGHGCHCRRQQEGCVACGRQKLGGPQ